MGIFDGQAEVHPLSDEALFGNGEEQSEEQQQVEEGQVDEAQPQEDTDEVVEESGAEELAPEGTSQEPEATATEDKVEASTETEDEGSELDQLRKQLADLQKQHNDLRSWSTKLSMENGRLRKQAEATTSKPAEAQAEPKTPKDFLKDLVNGGEEGFNAAVDKRAREIIAPLLAEREEERQLEQYRLVFNEATETWRQLTTEDGKSEMIRRMVELAANEGNPEGWKQNPDLYIFRACKELWGLPKVVDTEAIEAARRMEREAVIKEYSEKQNKNGLAAHPPANKDNTNQTKTPEQEIIEEMKSSWHSGVF